MVFLIVLLIVLLLFIDVNIIVFVCHKDTKNIAYRKKNAYAFLFWEVVCICSGVGIPFPMNSNGIKKKGDNHFLG
jgi:hypothetical protein